MLANFFGKSKFLNFLVVYLSFFLFFWIHFFNNQTLNAIQFIDIANEIPLLFCYFFILYSAYKITVKHSITFDNSYFLFSFVILIFLFPIGPSNFVSLASIGLYLIFLYTLFHLQLQHSLISKLYDSGFILGVFFFIEPFSLVYFILIFIAITLYSKISFRNILVPILGFLTPVIILFTYHFWFDQMTSFMEYFYLYTPYKYGLFAQARYVIPLLCMGIFVLFSIVLKTPKTLLINNTFKKTWGVLIGLFCISAGYLFLLPDKNEIDILFIVFPSAIIIANGFEVVKSNFLKNSLMLFLLLFLFWTTFFIE